MSDEVMIMESSDVNFSSIDATTTETETGSLTGNVSVANQMILRVAIILILSIINLGGNGFTLTTIQLTPRL